MIKRAVLIRLLEQWLRQADGGNWRDKAGLSLKAAPVVDDTRGILEALRNAKW
jgi:hypothetical protein